ncbi:MAG: hypothetical protein ACXVRJ_00050 [Gaiellaceae bacterium]
MTSGLVRLYAALVAIVCFFVAWAAVAAHPWREASRDPRLAALDERRAQVRHEAAHTRRVLARRYAAYRVAFRERERAIARARAEQARLDAEAVAARARYAASTPVRTVTVYTHTAATPPPASSQLASAPVPVAAAPAPAPVGAPAPAPAPAPPPPPPVVSIPPVATTKSS